MNKTAQSVRKLFEKSRKRLEYFVQGAIISFTEAVTTRMTDLKISKSELAGKLKCKPSYVTKALGGGTNFTLESMVKIALALDSEVEIVLTPKDCAEKLEDVLQSVTQIKPVKQEKFDWSISRGNLIQLPTITSGTSRFYSDERIITIAA
jgi:transcriptional regulator with XRE-family HTH domain